MISSPALIRTDSAVVKSDQVGGNFAYSTLQANTYTPVAAPVVALRYSVARPLYHPIYNPSFVTSPIYGGLLGHPSFISQAPIVAQNPIFGYPGLIPGQGPIQSPVPVQPPVAAPPQGISPGDIPAGGEALDDDTVSVDAAF